MAGRTMVTTQCEVGGLRGEDKEIATASFIDC